MRVPEFLRRAADASTEFGTTGLLCLLSLTGWAEAGFAVAILPGDIVAISSTAQGDGDGAGSIIHIDPVTGGQTVIAPGSYIDFGLTQGGRIFAITGSELVEVQPGSGDVRIVRDLSDLGSPKGLAVGPTGSLFVAYEDAGTRLDGIEAIDAGSGSGSTLSSLGSFGRVADLEFITGGNLAALAETPGGDPGDLFVQIVDSMTGTPVVSELFILRGTALGVSQGGDLVAAAAFGLQGTQARELFVATGETVPLNIPLYADADGTCAFSPPDCDDDLLRSDLAYEASGRILLSVNGFQNSPPWTKKLFRLETDGTSQIVTDGTFSELQVAVPEPSTVHLLVAGLLGVACWRRAARNEILRTHS